MTVLANRQRGARETLADRRCGVGSGGAVLELEGGPVGESDLHLAQGSGIALCDARHG